tara:strand:+ start:122 stop:271 length:150 start_codon:yes stop_codon:yes gene_type:complete
MKSCIIKKEKNIDKFFEANIGDKLAGIFLGLIKKNVGIRSKKIGNKYWG